MKRQPAKLPEAEASAAPKRLDLAPLRRMAGFTIHLLDVQQYQLFYRLFGDPAFTPAGFATLVAIGANPGVRHGELADALMIRRPNMTLLLNRLEREGYIARRRADDDRRSAILCLTEKGEGAVPRMLAQMSALDARLTATLSPPERRTLLALLQKLAVGVAPES